MKKRVLWLRYLFLFLAFASASVVYAQEVQITGKVTDAADGSSIPGATVVIKGTTTGAVTDIDGNFSIKAKKGDVLVISYMGYQTQEITVGDQKTINVSMATGVKALGEIVVIGYGTVKKQDATGAVIAIDSKDFNKGAVNSPQQAIIGKIPGVQVTTIGGAPGGDAVIQIRGYSSISASNDPLVVIDGVPIDNAGTSGARGSLTMINPDDIETYTVLKDASATAIFGSRASAGVILITTKKGKAGGKKFNVDYSGNFSVYTVPKTYDVLNGDEYRSLLMQKYPPSKDSSAYKLLGNENTDWQKQIFRVGTSIDHNLAFSSNINTKGFQMPFRISAGYFFQDGILKTDNMNRTSVNANLSPSFFKNYLKITLNAKYMHVNNFFADNGAIGNAIAFDPTKPVYDYGNKFGGYWTWTQANGDPVDQATTNPVALLNLKQDEAKVNRFLGNAQIDYKLHFWPDMRVNLNLGTDYSKSKGTVNIPENSNITIPTGGVRSWVNKGVDNKYDQTKKNNVLDFYLNYVKDVKSIKSKFDVMAGYSWQHFYYENNDYHSNVPHDTAHTDTLKVKKEYYLVSFYGRFNYTLANRYLLTFTLRDDGSSKFSKSTRWGIFPSVALAWKINEEKFLRDSKVLSQLKLRLGWGRTGQQAIGDNWYPYQPIYTASNQYAMYQFGNIWYTTFRPEGYDPNIKWETAETYNAGFDFGFLKDRLRGSIDYFYKKNYDLLNFINVPAGSNLSNFIWTNIGDMENQGFEFALDYRVIAEKDWNWTIGGNVTYYKNKITKLTLSDDPSYPGVAAGPISGGVGNTVQMQSVGYPIYSFYVYQQVYDASGKPIEGLYVDRNGDGKISDADRYHYKSANPDVTFGINSTISYKNLSLAFAGHASIGNYVYDNNEANRAVYSNIYRPEGPYLGNVGRTVYDVNFNNQQYLSDYYIKNASFFKMDYITLSYLIKHVIDEESSLRVSFTVNNVFTITKYPGLDPEVILGQTNVGIDNNVYPRSRVFVVGVNLSF